MKFAFFIALPAQWELPSVLEYLGEQTNRVLFNRQVNSKKWITQLHVGAADPALAPLRDKLPANKLWLELERGAKRQLATINVKPPFLVWQMRCHKHPCLGDDGNVTLPVESASPNRKWGIWIVQPEGIDVDGDGSFEREDRDGLRVFNLWRKFRLSAQNVAPNGRAVVLGPWSAKSLWTKRKDLANKLIFSQVPIYGPEGRTENTGNNIIGWEPAQGTPALIPWCILGDDPRMLAKIDYDPHDLDIEADVIPEKETWSVKMEADMSASPIQPTVHHVEAIPLKKP